MAVSRRRGDATARLQHVDSLAAASACPELLGAVRDPSIHVARAALRRLADLGCQDEARVLAESLLEIDIGLVRDCARVLARLERRPGAEAALVGLKSASAHRRQAAAMALEELAWPPARTTLELLVDDPAAAVRRAVVAALGVLPAAPRTNALVLGRLADRDPSVRAVAVGALARLSPNPSAALQTAVADPDPRVRRALASVTPRLSHDLVGGLLSDSDPDVRVETLWRLVDSSRVELVREVEGCSRDDSWQVRRAACRALGAAHSEPSTLALVDRLLDPHATVREAALRALREIHGVRAARVVAERLTDGNAALRAALLYAVARIDERAAAGAIRAYALADDPAAGVRIAVCQVSDPVRSATILGKLAADRDAGVRNAALHALSPKAGRDG